MLKLNCPPNCTYFIKSTTVLTDVRQYIQFQKSILQMRVKLTATHFDGHQCPIFIQNRILLQFTTPANSKQSYLPTCSKFHVNVNNINSRIWSRPKLTSNVFLHHGTQSGYISKFTFHLGNYSDGFIFKIAK